VTSGSLRAGQAVCLVVAVAADDDDALMGQGIAPSVTR
jgi:hypothetical protein